MVPGVGLEPTRGFNTSGDFKSPVSTIPPSRLVVIINLEARAGIAPAHGSFADSSVSTSPPGRYYRY